MRIYVKVNDIRVPLIIIFPTVLLLNDLTAHIAAHFLKKHTPDTLNISPKKIKTFIRAIHKANLRFPGWKLVEIDNENGDRIIVKL